MPNIIKLNKKAKATDASENAEAENFQSTTEQTQTSNIVDLSTLTEEDLLAELTRRMTASSDTKLKRALSQIVERKSLPAKRRGFTQKAKIMAAIFFIYAYYKFANREKCGVTPNTG